MPNMYKLGHTIWKKDLRTTEVFSCKTKTDDRTISLWESELKEMGAVPVDKTEIRKFETADALWSPKEQELIDVVNSLVDAVNELQKDRP